MKNADRRDKSPDDDNIYRERDKLNEELNTLRNLANHGFSAGITPERFPRVNNIDPNFLRRRRYEALRFSFQDVSANLHFPNNSQETRGAIQVQLTNIAREMNALYDGTEDGSTTPANLHVPMSQDERDDLLFRIRIGDADGINDSNQPGLHSSVPADLIDELKAEALLERLQRQKRVSEDVPGSGTGFLKGEGDVAEAEIKVRMKKVRGRKTELILKKDEI